MSLEIYRFHIIFNADFEYKNLAKIFSDLVQPLRKEIILIKTTGNAHSMTFKDMEFDERFKSIIDKNIDLLRLNEKPEGINWDSRNIRMMFPISDIPRFYIYSNHHYKSQVERIRNIISDILDDNNISHKLDYDVLNFKTRDNPMKIYWKI